MITKSYLTVIAYHDVDSIQDTVLLKHRLGHFQVVGTHHRIHTTRHLGKNKYAETWNPPGVTWKVETLDKKVLWYFDRLFSRCDA